MASTSLASPRVERPKRERSDIRAALLLGGPAFILLLVFLIGPFFMGILYSFTDQRLISPNPTQFVGTRNYERLLGVSLLTLDPITDPKTGQPQRDAQGNLQYPRSRTYTRDPQKYPQYAGLTEATSIDIGDAPLRHCWPRDPTFLSALLAQCLLRADSHPVADRAGAGCWRSWSTRNCAGGTSSARPITARS